jgi:hypothetical protein
MPKKPPEPKRPAFEVLTSDGHRYAIWENGHVEGFPPGSIIINRIPHIRDEHAVHVLGAYVKANAVDA